MDLVEVIDARAFAITERIEPEIIQIGNTNSRMVIIPNFFLYPDQIREYALTFDWKNVMEKYYLPVVERIVSLRNL